MKTILKDESGDILFEGEAAVQQDEKGTRYTLSKPDFLFDLLLTPEGPVLKTKETLETVLDFPHQKATIQSPYGELEADAGLVAVMEDDDQIVLVYWVSNPDEPHTLILLKEPV